MRWWGITKLFTEDMLEQNKRNISKVTFNIALKHEIIMQFSKRMKSLVNISHDQMHTIC